MDWIKKHVDTVIVLGGLLSSVLWMNNKFSEVEKEIGILKTSMAVMKSDVEKEIGFLRTDMAVMKTVMIMKNIMPNELAHKHEDKPCISN